MPSRSAIPFLLLMASLSAVARPPVLADYAAVIEETGVRADGQHHLNTQATLERLRALHANTYFFLVQRQRDWDDLRLEFLPAAAKSGLDVWPYFVPPSECPAPCALPFGEDYVRTATEISRLSLAFPNLKGWAIDDFADNVKLFTPEYVGKLRNAGREVNPRLLFYPLLYWRSMEPEFLDPYSTAIDGVILAYRDEPTVNTSRNTTLRAQLTAAESLLRERGKSLILMIYCAPLGRLPIPPGVDYVRDSVSMGLSDAAAGKLAGVVTYALDKSGERASATRNYAHGGRGRATISASGKGIPAGSYGELASPVTVAAAQPVLRFWCTASYTRLPPGYFFVQVSLGDRVVWERDLSALGNNLWEPELVEIAGAVSGDTIHIRLSTKRSTGSISVLIGVDDLEGEDIAVSDPGFEAPGKWIAAQTDPAYLPLVQVFDPELPIRLFEAVSAVYARYSSF